MGVRYGAPSEEAAKSAACGQCLDWCESELSELASTCQWTTGAMQSDVVRNGPQQLVAAGLAAMVAESAVHSGWTTWLEVQMSLAKGGGA